MVVDDDDDTEEVPNTKTSITALTVNVSFPTSMDDKALLLVVVLEELLLTSTFKL